MRRSKAPSLLNKVKQNENSTNPEEPYDWGSRNVKFTVHKRIFNVLWRDATTRKHKIWKGDGSLEVDIHRKAILKDESGKYMGCLAKVDLNRLVPEYQMIISGKEIEIQNEVKDDEALQNLRKMQAQSFTNNESSFASYNLEETENPEDLKFNPILMVKSAKLTLDERNIEKERYDLESRETKKYNQYEFLTDKGDDKPNFQTEFICFLKPSELQMFLFQKTLEYISCRKSENIENLNVDLILKMICNHPSLINNRTTTNELLRHLIQVLPDWMDMGPFDSAKLEFVQYFLTGLTKSNQTCIILAKNSNVLNMLQGLCDFMKVKCLRLNANNLKNFDSEIRLPEEGSFDVILITSIEMLSCSNLSTFCKSIIVFEEYLEFSNICSVENLKDITVYYLVTAFSIEELCMLDTYNNIENVLNDLDDMNKEYDCCYLHSKIKCNCFESFNKTLSTENFFIKNWNHFKPPFDLHLLKGSSLENSSDNIISIFCKKIIK